MNKLSFRLETILKMVPSCDYVADIGADHGLVSVELIKRGISKRVFAVENKLGPFNRLNQEVVNNGLEKYIETSLSSGISLLPNDVHTVILAGMGGKLIVNILNNNKEKLQNVNYIIIDAHSGLEYLRREVVSLGYKITKEDIVLEDKVYYEIMLFEKGNECYDDDQYYFGPILSKEKCATFILKWMSQIKKYQTIIDDEKVCISRKKALKSEIERIDKQL